MAGVRAGTGRLGFPVVSIEGGPDCVYVPRFTATVGWSVNQLDRFVEILGGSEGLQGLEEVRGDIGRRRVSVPSMLVAERYCDPTRPDWVRLKKWVDVVSFVSSMGVRLLRADEWEALVRGPENDDLFPWGNNLLSDYEMDVWMGQVPDHRGIVSTAAGLVDVMKGEWTSSVWVGDYGGQSYDGEPIVVGGGSWFWGGGWQNAGDAWWSCTAWRVPKGAWMEKAAFRPVWELEN